jgi:outer membrane receptor protein involved in Fe transport
MKKNLLLYCLLFLGVFAQGQELELRGLVVDKMTGQPIEFATVLLADPETKKPITGVTTDLDGRFKMTTDATVFFMEISFIGYIKTTVNQFDKTKKRIDLGTITLEQDVQNLSEVTVTGEKSTTEFKLDKRVFNVGKDLSSAGASALEVLNNIPSVTVDIEGAVSLRGSQGVQMLINGKPSVLTSGDGTNALGTITADMIEKIEVITNPSAKYEAAGTSGILNIVLKKDEKKGLNGSVTLNTGIPDNHSLGLSLNRRSEKLNIFSQIGIGRRSFPSDNRSLNRNLENGVTIENIGDHTKNEKFYNFILGADFFLNENNVITLSGNYALEQEDEIGNNNYTEYDASNQAGNRWDRVEDTEATNPKWQYELQYKSDFTDHEDHDLLFSAMGSSFVKDSETNFTTTGDRQALERNLTDFGENEYTFKLDYTRPLSKTLTVETGAQYAINDVSNDYEVLTNTDGNWVTDPNQTNVFNYDQGVLGVYGTVGYEKDPWGIKLGLRMENTNLETYLETDDARNVQDYTDFFPSVHTSYKFSDELSLQAGYSKRISRPHLWILNPFFVQRDILNIRRGNPNLLPEYTDSYEVTSIFKLGDVSMNLAAFHRYTTDIIEDVVTTEEIVIEGETVTRTVSTPENVGTAKTYGLEMNAKYSAITWMTLSMDANYGYFERDGEYEGQVFDFTGNRGGGRFIAKFKLPADIDLEATGNYRSGYRELQEVREPQYFMDMGVRKKILKGKAILNLSVRDVFASRKFESTTSQPTFYLENSRQRGRFVTLGVSFGFGKGEAMEFSGQKRF